VAILQPPGIQLRLRIVDPLRGALGGVHPERQFLELRAADRLGQHQPAERPWPCGQQPVLQVRPDGPGGLQIPGGEQAVSHPGDPHPARQPRQHLRQPAAPHRLTAAAGRKLQHHMSVTRGGRQPSPGRQHLHRPAHTIPYPSEPDRLCTSVIGSAQRRSPLPRQQITVIIRAARPLLTLCPPRNLRDPPRIQPGQQLPGRRHHHGSLYTIRNGVLSQSNYPESLE
jgi:hypothetical protein